MSWLSGWLRQRVTIVTPTPSTDRYGNERVDFTNATREDVLGHLEVKIRFIEESTTDEQVTTLTGFLFLPSGTAITDACRVEIAGETWEVVGATEREFLGRRHIEARLRREIR